MPHYLRYFVLLSTGELSSMAARKEQPYLPAYID